MSQLAIGMIETVGLAAGIEAADVCLKSANVTLIGYELTKGNGMTVVKIEGNVGAVKAAIEAATVAANKVSKVFSTKVIPRPSEGIDFLMRNCDTVGYESEKAVEELVEIYEDSDEDKNNFSTKVIPRPSEGIDFLMRNCDTVGYESEKAVEELVEIYEDSDEDKNKENIEEDKDNTQEKIEVEVSEEISEHQINIEELEIEEDDSKLEETDNIEGNNQELYNTQEKIEVEVSEEISEHQINIEELEIEEDDSKLEETDNIEGNNQELSQIDNSEDESKDGHNLMHDIIDKFKKKSTTEVEYTCNLCKDPKCPRQKGDLKTTCIHYEDQNK